MTLKFKNYFSEILIFSILVLALLMLTRVGNVLIFGDWQDTQASLVFFDDFLFKGLRFDLKFLASILLIVVWFPALLLSWFMPDRWFSYYIKTAFTIVLLLLVYIVFVDIGYIFYFQKPIDVLIFGLFEDDTRAIISTILDNLNIILFFFGCFIFAVIVIRIFFWLTPRFKKTSSAVHGTLPQIIFWIVSFVVLVVLSRGSLDAFPLQRKHASVSDNTFLNSMVMNSPFNLYYAFRDQRVNNEAIFKQDILKTNQIASLDQLIEKAGFHDSKPLIKTTAKNENLEKVKPHVIFIFMEGWSSQIALAQSENNNVLGEFALHADEDYFFTRFLADTYATNPAIESLLINSPITPLSQSIANKTQFNLSNVLPFKNQGYQALFLSGGYSSWRNHNNFWLAQGFDSYIGRSEIENHFTIDASDNPWGVYDQYVFDYLKKSLQQAEQKSVSLFSAVLTTNNHPPIRLPDSYQRPSLSPSVFGFDDADESKLSLLSGFHYQTDQLGKFISWIKNSEFKDKVIIVATGDHPQRTFIDNSANAEKYLRYSVPAYFYVPENLDQLKGIATDIPGAHADLFPTLFELSLSNADYYNFGQVFMDKTASDAYGRTSSGEYIFTDGLVDSRNNKFYRWLDDQHLLLNSASVAVTDEQLSVINTEHYRRLLKQYLIIEDYQQRE